MKRINKTEARRRFNAGETITLIPCKCGFNPYWQLWVTIDNTDVDNFDKCVNAFIFYNCNYETGYYPHYYINESEELTK